MNLRALIAGIALVSASSAAFAVVPTKFENQYALGTVGSPLAFIVQNDVSTPSFDDFITFSVNPSSYATDVLFSQLSLHSGGTNYQAIDPANTSLTLWDVTSGNPATYFNFGSVPLNEPPFTAAEVLLSGHLYALEVKGTLLAGNQLGTYAIGGNLSPVPEPETFALLGMGAVALVAARARRRKRTNRVQAPRSAEVAA